MKALVVARGQGTSSSEETLLTEPVIEIGGKPIFRHIMKLNSAYGIDDFITCCGYEGHVTKEYFARCFLHAGSKLPGMFRGRWRCISSLVCSVRPRSRGARKRVRIRLAASSRPLSLAVIRFATSSTCAGPSMISDVARESEQGLLKVSSDVRLTVRAFVWRIADDYKRCPLPQFGARTEIGFDAPRVLGHP